MSEVIFSKFSAERKSEYAIVTKILEKEGTRSVVKEALYPRGRSHIQTLPEKMELLKQYYRSDDLVVTPCRLEDVSTVEFEYEEGVHFEEYLNELIKNKQYDRVREKLLALARTLGDVTEVTEFTATEEFMEVFGEHDYSCLNGKKAYTVSDIDLIFSNLILKDGKIYLTDYEWVFEFPVPIQFVLYRSLLLDGSIAALEQDVKEELYRTLGISKEEEALYYQMELGFQSYVSGENVLERYEKQMDCGLFRLTQVPVNILKQHMKIFGVCAGTERLLDKRKINGRYINMEIPAAGLDRLKFRMNFKGAILRMDEVTGIRQNGESQPLEYQTNRALEVNGNSYFSDVYPEIEIDVCDFEQVKVKITFYYWDSGIIGDYVESISGYGELERKLAETERDLVLKDGDLKYREEMIRAQDQKIKDLEEQVLSLRADLYASKVKIQQMESTKVWKLYQKFKGQKSEE